MKLREGDIFYGTVGILGLCGVVFVVQAIASNLGPLIGHQLAMLVATPVIVWGGMTSFMVTYRAFKGGFGRPSDAPRP
jgi:hypothetical protein